MKADTYAQTRTQEAVNGIRKFLVWQVCISHLRAMAKAYSATTVFPAEV